MSPAAFDTRQKVLGKVFTKLLAFVEDNAMGELRIAPYVVYFDKENILQPDILPILNENASKIEERAFLELLI